MTAAATGPISRADIYAFERQATATDRMPMSRATRGAVSSSFVSPVQRASVFWVTTPRGDLYLLRSNALKVLQRLQEVSGAAVDHYWGSVTRTNLLQYTGLSDRPGAVVSMRDLIEAAIAKTLLPSLGPVTVVIPQAAQFPSTNALTYVGGDLTPGDSLRYWDGARGTFRPAEASTEQPVEASPTTTNSPSTIAPTPTPTPTPAAPRRTGRIAMVVRVTLAPGQTSIDWDRAQSTIPSVTIVEQQQELDRLRVVVDGPDGFSAPFLLTARLPDGTALTPVSVPLTFRGDVQQNIEATYSTATGAFRIVSNTDVPLNSPASDGSTQRPVQQPVQQAGLLTTKNLLITGAVVGSLYLWDRSRPPAKRWFKSA